MLGTMTHIPTTSLPTRPFGASRAKVTWVGLGGEGVLRTYGYDAEANAVIQEATRQGIGYFDTARAYAGSEQYLGTFWKSNTGAREQVFHTSKTAERFRNEAYAELRRTLENLGTDYLDLWQIHDVRTASEMKAVAGPGGALEAFRQARDEGLVKHIGVTGHHDPEILTRCVEEWPLDSVLLPVNPVEATLGGFLTQTLPAAREKGMAIIGMKVLGGGNYIIPDNGITPPVLLRYALSQPVTCIIVGCASPAEVATLAEAARQFVPMDAAEQEALVRPFAPHASRLGFYRGHAAGSGH